MVRISIADLVFTARMEEETAPRTCAAFRALLPFHGKLLGGEAKHAVVEREMKSAARVEVSPFEYSQADLFQRHTQLPLHLFSIQRDIKFTFPSSKIWTRGN